MNKFFTLATALCVATGAYAADTVYDLVPQSWSPADGETVDYASGYELRFGVTFTDDSQRPIDGAKGTLTCAENGYSSDVNITWFEMVGQPLVKLATEPTADGTYVLEMPQGQWGDADFIAGNGGHANAAFTYTYTVTGLGSGETQKTCTVVSTDPADGSAIAGFPYESTLTVNTTDNTAVGDIDIYIYDVTNAADETTGGEYLFQGYNYHNNTADPIVWTCYSDILEFEKGCKYRVDLVMFSKSYEGPDTPVACKHSLYYTGTTEAYVYSPVKLVATQPDPATYVVESAKDFKFTAVFDGYVNVDLTRSGFNEGMGASLPITEDQVSYNPEHTEVTISFDENFLAGRSDATAILFITDKDGLVVSSGDDLKANSHFTIAYVCELDLTEVNVTPAEGVVTAIDKIAVSCDEFGGEMNLSFTAESEATISTLQGEVLRTLEAPLATKTSGTGANEIVTEFTFTVEPPITEPGRYLLIIPKGYFNLGSEFNTSRSAAVFVTYDIEAEEGAITYDYIPTVEGSSIAPLSYDPTILEMLLKWPSEEATINYEVYGKSVVKDAEGNVIEDNLPGYGGSWDDYSLMGPWVTAAKYVDGNAYTITIPKDSFGDLTWNDSGYTAGRANPELEVKFTTTEILSISETSAVEANIIDAAAVNNDVYNLQGVLVLRNATIEQVRQLPAGLYIFGGRKIAVK